MHDYEINSPLKKFHSVNVHEVIKAFIDQRSKIGTMVKNFGFKIRRYN